MLDLPNALMIVIDQLPAYLLGPYGNTLIETENFNAFAADSLLFDFAVADSVDLSHALKRAWFPCASDRSESILGLPTGAQIETILITDDPRVAQHSLARFDQIVQIDHPEFDSGAKEIADTQLVNFFAEVAAWLDTEWETGQLCWVHSKGLGGTWDAPYPLRQRFAGEDDPNPPRFIDLSHVQLDEGTIDPDQQLGLQQAAAAQVAILDQCLGILEHAWLPKLKTYKPLIGLTSLRGCGLGEHGELGIGYSLHSEVIQVPLMIRFPNDHRAISTLPTKTTWNDWVQWPKGRSSMMVSVAEACQLFVAWLHSDQARLENILEDLDAINPTQSQAVIVLNSDRQQMIQTPAWKLLRDLEGKVQLFAKPDDRWEISDVSNRCPQIVEQLLVWLDRLQPNPSNHAPITSIHRHLDVHSELMERWD